MKVSSDERGDGCSDLGVTTALDREVAGGELIGGSVRGELRGLGGLITPLDPLAAARISVMKVMQVLPIPPSRSRVSKPPTRVPDAPDDAVPRTSAQQGVTIAPFLEQVLRRFGGVVGAGWVSARWSGSLFLLQQAQVCSLLYERGRDDLDHPLFFRRVWMP